MHFDLYGSVRSNSCKDMVNKKNIRFSAMQHTAVSQWPRVPQGSSEKKQAGGGDGGAGGSAGCCGRVV